MAISLLPTGLALPGAAAPASTIPLLSGALHYFRTSPAHWQRALQAIAQLGFPLVESYVPWGVHEVAPGRHRFSGPYDLGRFLDLAAEAGLLVILRPGPHINAELPWFGFPERLVHDARLCMRTAQGHPLLVPLPPRMFAAPSYAAARLYEETARWYAAVGEVVAPRLHPRGPVVALQVDNEQPLFFRTAAYDGDYHEEALAAFRDWQLQRGYQEAEAPRSPPAGATDPAALLPHLRWLAFKEHMVVAALRRLGGLLDEAGLAGVPRFHNFPPADPGPFDVAAAETALDCAGIDMYHRKSDYRKVRRRSLYLLGTSRYPYVPEMGAGSFPWGPPLTDADGQNTLLNALCHGVRGFNLYMATERDRWYGAPLSETGQPRTERAGFYQRLLQGLRDVQAATLSADAPIGVLLPREYQRLTLCATHLGPTPPIWLDWFGWDAEMACRSESFGLKTPVQQAYPYRREALLGALDRLGRRHVLVDASCVDDQLQRLKALVVPTYELLDRALGQRLRRFVASGGTLIIGPEVPDRDEDMMPCDHGLSGERVHLLPPDDSQLLPALRAALPPPGDDELAYQPEDGTPGSTIDVMVHRDAAGRVGLVGVGNGAAEAVTGRLPVPSPTTLRDLVSGEKFAGDAVVAVPLPPFGVRLLSPE